MDRACGSGRVVYCFQRKENVLCLRLRRIRRKGKIVLTVVGIHTAVSNEAHITVKCVEI
jgi:hypothetical protein